MRNNIKSYGFTLLEILIALFIFAILSTILVSALHHIINIESGTESKAERLRHVQVAMLLLSRDIEQTVNRPVVNASGKQEAAFIGDKASIIFTSAGVANPTGDLMRSSFKRVEYRWHDNALWRLTWSAVDQPPEAKPKERLMLADVSTLTFEYLDKAQQFQNQWPLQGESSQPLPRAVRVYITLSDWGKMSQLYVIPAEPTV